MAKYEDDAKLFSARAKSLIGEIVAARREAQEALASLRDVKAKLKTSAPDGKNENAAGKVPARTDTPAETQERTSGSLIGRLFLAVRRQTRKALAKLRKKPAERDAAAEPKNRSKHDEQ